VYMALSRTPAELWGCEEFMQIYIYY